MICCLKCGGATSVTDTRNSSSGIRRRRACLSCGARVSTVEVVTTANRRRDTAHRLMKERDLKIIRQLCANALADEGSA